MPPPGISTHRSRGIDSMVTDFELGSTRTRIIDWVLYRSWTNFESSSEPSRRTVKGSVGPVTVIGLMRPPPELTTGVVEDWSKGKKKAPRPMRPARRKPRTMNHRLGSGFSARAPYGWRTRLLDSSLTPVLLSSTEVQRVEERNTPVTKAVTGPQKRPGVR